jgi:hypothetical protein
MKIKRYKLKDGVTKEELIAFGAKEGGSFAVKGATLLLHKFVVPFQVARAVQF